MKRYRPFSRKWWQTLTRKFRKRLPKRMRGSRYVCVCMCVMYVYITTHTYTHTHTKNFNIYILYVYYIIYIYTYNIYVYNIYIYTHIGTWRDRARLRGPGAGTRNPLRAVWTEFKRRRCGVCSRRQRKRGKQRFGHCKATPWSVQDHACQQGR
jgi:hypothetical protein